MGCPNVNLESWKELEASVGTQRAHYLWDKYDGKVPQEEYTQDVSIDLIPQIQELNNFVLFEDKEKLCAGGICNFTAAKSTEMLKEAGLNPFPNPGSYGGATLPVTVKSPLGDFFITHYVAASAINDSIYIYDMPQNEFVSDEDMGMGDVSLKTAFKPRLIPLTIDSIKANYNLNSEDAAKFIRSILNRQATNINPTFRSYINDNIKNSNDYIKSLEDQISSEGVMLDSREEYRIKEESLKELQDKKRERKLSKPLTSKEENKVINFLRNKLKLKTREYLPTKSTSFTLGNIIKSVTGLSFDYSRENLDTALEEFKTYTESDKFLSDVWDKYSLAKSNLDNINQSLDKLFSFKRLLDGFFNLAKTQGIKNALSKYDSKQQYKLKTFLPSDILTRYASDKQAVFMLQKRYSNINVIIATLNINFGKPLTEIMKNKMKLNAQFEKANTVLNYLKAVDFDPSYIYESIANEAKRRYAYFEKQGDVFFQTEEMPMSKASTETLNKVKEAAKKMGIDIQALAAYAKSNPEMDLSSVNGVADLMRGIIGIAEGKESIALTEEMVHLATAILEQTNPKMITEMISKIDKFKIYDITLKQYSGNKNYQLANGKPDIRKIKKEAVDKLIAEIIVNKNENIDQFPELREEINQSTVRNWWRDILDWIRGIYKKSNISIFEEAASQIISGDIGTVEDITGEGVFFQVSDIQKSIMDKLDATDEYIEKVVEVQKTADPLLLDSEEANNYYRTKKADGSWERVVKRVTDRVQAWYKSKFGAKQFTPEEKAFNELKRKFGVQGHKDLEEIHKRFYHKNGTKREIPLDKPIKFDNLSEGMYTELETYYTELIKMFDPNTIIRSEVVIYDKKNKEAGTLDFLAIEPSGKTHILDWKFMHITKEDVAWFKQGAFNIQLGTYKQILRDNYGIKEFGMTRAIPISMEFRLKDKNDAKAGYDLKGIAVGSADPRKITDIRLVPISEATESTGFEALDSVIKKMNALLAQIGREEVSDEQEREFKIERLNTLRRAIKKAQGSLDIAPLVGVIEVMRKEGDRILGEYNTTYKDRPARSSDSNNSDLSDFSGDMNNFIKLSDIFVNIGRQIGNLVYTDEMLKQAKTDEEIADVAQRKQILDKLRAESDAIYDSKEKITAAALSFADKHIGERNLVTGLLKPERVLKGLASLFRGAADLPNRAIQILTRLTGNAQTRAAQDALEEVKELMAIREKLAAKGGDLRKLIQQIYQKDDKGKLVNKLIYVYNREFHDTVDKKAEEGGDKTWLVANIDVLAYQKEAGELLKKQIDRIEKTIYTGTEQQEYEQKQKEIQRIRRQWDIEHEDFIGWNNYIIKRHPLPKWYSEEYKKIKGDPELLELYNFINTFNEKAKDVGYIDNQVTKTFLPFIRKSMAEELVWDNRLSVMNNFYKSLQINPDDVGYGRINEVTGELENSIPKYYTSDFRKKAIGSYTNYADLIASHPTGNVGDIYLTKDTNQFFVWSATSKSWVVDGVNDYSEVSEDLFKNMILYIQQVNKYKYMSEVEGQLKLVKTIEEFKNHLKTNRVGNVVREGGMAQEVEGNVDNTKIYDDFLRVLLYEQKYVLSDSDVPLNIDKVLNFVKNGVNKLARREVWKPNEGNTATSLMKTIDAANRGFQLKTLGFEFISGAVNMFGGNIQIATQAGNYFKAREFAANEAKLTMQKFANEEDKEMFVQLLNTFTPMKDDPSYQMYKDAGMSALTRANVGDTLMFFMRQPELLIEKSAFLTLLQNMMIVDGKIVSINEFVKAKYKDRYTSAAKYNQVKDKINSEVEELKKTKSIDVTKKLVNGKLEIPGLDLNNKEELQRLTNLSRRIASNATGSMTKENVNRMSMSIWTKSMMVFKNWIPKLADTRFSEFRKVSDDFSVRISDDGVIEGEKYDIGRIRLLLSVISDGLFKGVTNLNNIINLNDAGLERLDEMFEEFRKTYEEETGETLNMDRDQFIDLIRTNLRNQLKELAILGALVGVMLSLGFLAPDDDDDKSTKNLHRYALRVTDKFVGELSFFYNPAEFEQTLSGGIFPAMGIAKDFSRFLDHFIKETTGLDLDHKTSTEDVRKKAQPIKNLMKMLPVTKSAVTYLAIFNTEFAKEFDVTIQANNNR